MDRDEIARLPAGIDPTRPTSARVYDALLGGKNHFEVDRRLATMIMESAPEARSGALANRDFLRRAVTMVARAGVRQFLDIGAGLPTAQNTHHVAQAVAPEARVVYVDYDPMILAHARALLADNASTDVIQADLREPELILADDRLHKLIDLRQPVALALLAIVHFILDDEQARRIVRTLTDALAPGSYLLLSHLTADDATQELGELATAVWRNSNTTEVPKPRTAAQLREYFDGLELLDPGIVPLADWHPDEHTTRQTPFWIYAAVGRKPG
jgi:SAM-dependent methyltransferase